MRYFVTTTSDPRVREPRIINVGNMDDTEIMSFDSDWVGPKTEPRGSWIKRMGQKLWEEICVKNRGPEKTCDWQ